MHPIFLFIFTIVGIYTQTISVSNALCPSKCVCYGKSVRCMKLDLHYVPEFSLQTSLLDLRFNLIQELQDGFFEGHSHMKSILLSNNLLHELRNGSFTGLIHLRNLYLYKNRIAHIETGAFHNLLKLQHLYLQNNNLRTIGQNTFSNIVSLDRLYLYNNQIQNMSSGAFDNLPLLKRLRLDGNFITCDCSLTWLVRMLKYHSLQVDGNCRYPTELYKTPLRKLTTENLKCKTPQIMEDPHDVQLAIGENAVFSCRINEESESSISWMKNGEEVDLSQNKYSLLEDGSLMIKETSSEDNGKYQCVARNSYGEAKSRPAHMVFIESNKEQFGPPIITRKPSTIFTTNGASRIELVCEAVGNPKPQVSWSFNGIQLLSSNKHIINSKGSLIIQPVETGDHGTYTCLARNAHGSRRAEANVLIQSPPIFTSQPENVRANVGSAIKLECSAVGSPEPEITWYKNNNRLYSTDRIILSEDGIYLKIEKTEIFDSGLYTCEARNFLGHREVGAEVEILNIQSKPLKFKYKPYNMEAFVGNAIEMPCQAEGDPTPGIQWQKDGATMQRTGRAKISSTGSLYINNVGIEDQGRYECSAINDYGQIAASGYITVKDNPTIINIEGIGDQYVKTAFLEATEEVDRAINNTINDLFKSKGPHNSEQLFRLFRYPDAPTRELAKAAEVYERTLVNIRKHVNSGRVLNATKDFSYREILSKQHLDLIAQLSGCTTHRRIRNCSNTCFHNKFRSIDGTCNNYKNPTWGSSLTPFRRVLKPIYEDGFGKPVGWNKTRKYHGFPKPLSRLVSISIISTHSITPDNEITHMVMQWGQFLDHDLDHSLPSVSSQSWDGLDCKKSCEYAPPCFPMEVPPNDPRISKRRCIDFIRTSAVCGSGITSVFFDDIQPREQINQLTSYIDASQVYGYSEKLARNLRDLNSDGGRLREGPEFTGWKPLLPFASNEGMDCRRNLSETDINCFAAGDIRVNEQSGLIAMHTLWMREHNRLARRLKEINPQWTGEKLYHEARKIVGAAMQHITYKHWLPFIIGESGMTLLGDYQGYDENIQADISNVFATAALRFGHTIINPVLHRFNADFKPIQEGHLALRYAFFAPWRVVNEGGIDPLIRGLFTVPAKMKRPTENLNSELTEHLFRSAHAVALDLAAMNIQRSRDHALPGYLEYRKFCNLTVAETFEDLIEIGDDNIIQKLESLYGHPGNIDVFVGGILEDAVEGGRVGPLFQCLLVEQFRRLRDGDRFYYENPSVFSAEQLVEIKKYTLSHILCDDGDNITRVTKNVFVLPERQDGFIECSELHGIDLFHWQHCCEDCNLDNVYLYEDE